MSFYRKYRPQVIGEIDNLSVRDVLLSLLRKEKKEIPHAFLFSGTRGTGKTTAARVIAKLFNCTKPTKNGPCGTCEACTSIAQGRNLDVLEIDAASNRGIDEIRTLRDGIALTPISGSYKVYIIDEVHMLTTEAFNALLKTLEEPPAHAVFVLATTDPQKVPLTIKSRCVLVSFARAGTDEILSALERIVEKESIHIDREALRTIAKSADGSFRDAVKLLEQVSFHAGAITKDSISGLLFLATDKSVAEFLSVFLAGKTNESIEIVEDLIRKGQDVKTFLLQSLGVLETQLVGQVRGTLPEKWKTSDVRQAIKKLSYAFMEMKSAPILQLPLELAIVEFCEEQSEKEQEISDKEKVNIVSQSTKFHVHISSHVSPEKKDEQIQNQTFSDEKPQSGMLTVDRLIECWKDVIEEVKPFNHSVAGVLRSARPKDVSGGIVTIEAFYPFHKEKLSEIKTKEALAAVLKKLFGEKVKVEVVLGKK